jgi:hypothetical protein
MMTRRDVKTAWTPLAGHPGRRAADSRGQAATDRAGCVGVCASACRVRRGRAARAPRAAWACAVRVPCARVGVRCRCRVSGGAGCTRTP